jgi:site-specific DNA recombinase
LLVAELHRMKQLRCKSLREKLNIVIINRLSREIYLVFFCRKKERKSFSELTTPMLNEFVEKILVHEADYSSGERVQEVEIYLNFIGKFELPVKEPTAEEIAEHEKLKARRAKKAEYNRRYMEKRRKRIAGEEQKSKEVTVNG